MASNAKGPPDGEWGWMCVIGKLYCFFLMLGTSSAFGIIYIDLIDYFNTTREATAWIESLAFGFTLLVGPISSALTSRIGIQKTTAVGTFIAFSGSCASFFANGIPFLYVSYGVVMGFGLGLAMVPSMLIVVQYFKHRLGLANAFGSCGNGLGALVLPPLYTYLLGEYGWRGTMLILAGFILNGLVCAVIFTPPLYLKSSTNITPKTSRVTSLGNLFRYLCTPWLLLYSSATALAFLGFIVPNIHLPDMTMQMGIENYQAASLISIMGVVDLIGRIFFGWMSDLHCVNVVILQGVTLMLCGVVTAVCPHLTEFYAFAVYSVIYGGFIGVFISILPVAILRLVGLERTGDVLGFNMFLSGVTNTVASPLAGWLFDLTKTYNVSFYVAACSLFLAGVMNIIAMFLHKRFTELSKGEITMSVQTVSATNVIRDQNSTTLEQTHM